jgi:hypothetical protein
VGRANFVLRTLVVAAMAYGLEFLAEDLLQLGSLPRYLYVLQRVAVFSLFGIFWLDPIDGRLLDAGLAHWYRYPAFMVWIVSTTLPVLLPQSFGVGPALFLLLLILGGVIPGAPAPATAAATREDAQNDEVIFESSKKAPSLPLVDQVGFLRSLLTLVCLWLPLIWLDDSSRSQLGAWFARPCYATLSVVWAVKVIGRLEDAGKAPNVRKGLLVIFFVLSVELIRRIEAPILTQWWQSFPVFNNAAGFSLWLSHLNGYEKLGLFLLIQIPLACLPSIRTPTTSFSERPDASRNSELQAKTGSTNVLALCGPFEYLRILLVIGGACVPFIYMDSTSNGGAGSWIARFAYAVLVFFWLTFAHGRLKDAGLAHSEYPAQYFLVVTVAALMPLVLHWVNRFGALAIFVTIQTPTAFLKSVPVPEEEA